MLKGPISERKSSEAQTSGPVPSGGLPPDNEVPGKEPDSQQQDRRSSHGKVTGAMPTTLATVPCALRASETYRVSWSVRNAGARLAETRKILSFSLSSLEVVM